MATANETIERLLRHRSVRRFTDEPVGRERLELIIRSAQMASTSSNMQAYSVIAVDDPDKRRQIAEWAGGQRHVEQAPVFLVWCADLYRFGEAVRMHGGSFEPTLEYFIVSTVDAALAAQNAAVAAESLGLGIVYIGGIRNRLSDVAELLQVPPLVYPVSACASAFPRTTPTSVPAFRLRRCCTGRLTTPRGRKRIFAGMTRRTGSMRPGGRAARSKRPGRGTWRRVRAIRPDVMAKCCAGKGSGSRSSI
ncbi:hypothetical protein PACILC2_43970 [Paenibacillus cisolokensis]|uniref:Nitroreductase domain-containing protein n=1 Tax=Paenibacillus cisolokensis TaxID=1658519 RepID=A0ABQ4NC87_9BACL|nr:nitroreductase family protein [Paenibacillus cisolokensis]GIQ65829.1 hypothetical protein PACILC2_43970 [Paenibacillus cisolokensis]